MLIRNCQPEDMAFATRLAAAEGWRIPPHAYEDMLRLAPQGCFVAEAEGQPIGVVTSIVYGKLGWIANLMVRRDCRRQGVGQALLHRAIGHLLDSGVRTIGVDAALGAVPFYEQAGFHPGYEALHLRRGALPAPAPIPDSLVPLEMRHLHAVAMFDWAFFGGPRQQVLNDLLQHSPVAFVAQDREGVGGYLMAHQAGQEWVIGPWVCVRSAEPLLTNALAAIGAEPVRIAVPKVNEHALAVLRAQGFRVYYREMRMYQGDLEYIGRPQHIYAIVSPEKG
ncbi:MAG: GNAT family N-acetyltransferase [Anaerolineae bacterium]